MKKIYFRPWTEYAGLSGFPPVAAIKAMPGWYSKIPRFTTNEKKFKMFDSVNHNLSIKACSPFLDTLTAGYLLRLESDVYVELTSDGLPDLKWSSGGKELITMHDIAQISKSQIPDNCHDIAFKFLNNWSIKLPQGYSALITHPLNRTDLPFHVLTGIVDSDLHKPPINFPFFMKKQFEGIIEAGTPIAQIIPIKRETWSSATLSFDKNLVLQQQTVFFSKLHSYYKKFIWQKKQYS